jgi:hypothetical protein
MTDRKKPADSATGTTRSLNEFLDEVGWPRAKEPEALAWLTCNCGMRMAVSEERRPFSDPRHPRQTFQIVQVLQCSKCGGTREKRLAIGH